MARKNIFDSVMREEVPPAAMPTSAAPSPLPHAPPSPSALPKFGAAKSLSSSIDALARQANMLVEGQAIVEVDPALVDASFVADRMGVDDASYQELRDAIRARGQDSPVLLRPHPSKPGRYQVVFGHRRLRVSRELGRPLRAVIKSLADIEHVLAQGQENTARANLSFIEKVLFAQRLEEQNFEREVIQQALSVDYQTLSKMLTIPKVMAPEVIDAIGPARGVGRDRWLELRKLMEQGKASAIVSEAIGAPSFKEAGSPERFEMVFGVLAKAEIKKPAKKALNLGAGQDWKPDDGLVKGQIRRTATATTLVFKSSAKSNSGFGDYLTRNLDRLYADFRREEQGRGGR